MAKAAKTPSAHVAIVGTGVIGASWAACFLAKGFDVVATDPAEGAEARLRGFVSGFWPALRRIGVASGASTARLKFDSDLTSTVAGAVFVQENGPERVDIKRDLIARIDAAAPATTLIATSSSGILISEIQNAAARHPERVLVGHPFNPPHLIPLVEVVGGQATSAVAIERALAFYTALGKKPIHIRREIRGHVANRLQAALWREAFYLVSQGIASVSEVDTAISHGPGLRWALLGPFLTLHLSGGPGGVAHVLEHLGPPQQMSFANIFRGTRGLSQPPIDDIESYWSPAEKAQAMSMLARSIVGSPDTVRCGMDALIAETGADELMIVSDVYDHATRLRSLEFIASVARITS